MDRRYVIALVVVVLLVLALSFPSIAAAYTRSSSLTRCAELEAALARVRQQGGDPTESSRISAELASCYETARDAGATLDLGATLLRDCRTYQAQIDAEFQHLRSTDYSDTLKRTNTVNTILRLGGEMVTCLTNATERAESANALREIKQFAVEAIAKSRERSKCYREGGAGCGRFLGSSETSGDEKDSADAQRVYLPLDALVGTINAKISRVEAGATRTPSGAGVSLS